MQCLTPDECSKWLQERNIIEFPYANSRQGMKLQFEPPRNPRKLTAFVRQLIGEPGEYLGAFGEFSGALLQFIDWPTYNFDEMALISSLRRSHGEERWLIVAPGHLFTSTEAAEAIGHCYLAAIFDWNAYLYLPSGAAALYFWEGDLIDFSSCDQKIFQDVCEIVERFELRVTYKHTS